MSVSASSPCEVRHGILLLTVTPRLGGLNPLFGNPAIRFLPDPVALRPPLTAGLPLSGEGLGNLRLGHA